MLSFISVKLSFVAIFLFVLYSAGNVNAQNGDCGQDLAAAVGSIEQAVVDFENVKVSCEEGAPGAVCAAIISHFVADIAEASSSILEAAEDCFKLNTDCLSAISSTVETLASASAYISNGVTACATATITRACEQDILSASGDIGQAVIDVMIAVEQC